MRKQEKTKNASKARWLKKTGRKLGAVLVAAAMGVSMLPMKADVVQAANALSFSADSTYAAVSVESGKAINIKAPGWQTRTTVDGTYVEDGNKVTNTVLLKITPLEDQSGIANDEVKVKMEYAGIENETYPIRTEGGNDFVFADSDKRTDACEYVIQATEDDQGIIRDTTRDYYFSIQDSGEILRVADASQAAEFKFVENPVVTDFSYYIEHTATGKYVKANGVDQALTVNGEEADGVIADNLRWTAVWGEFNGRSVTFNSKEFPDSRWRGGSTEVVTQIAGSGHGGWESIRVVPNGDGTISLKDTADGKFFTVDDESKTIVKTGSTESSDENGKFVIHSVLPPEKAKNVQVTDVEDTAVTVSWDGVADTFYTGYKVEAVPTAVSGKETVTSDETADTTLRLEGLAAGTEYEFKVLTVNGESPAADSDAVTAQTKNGPRPVQATDLKAGKTKDGIKVEWKAVENADSYVVYRAPSAFAEYEKIGTADTTNYMDTKPNTKPDNYSNYYRIVAVNENGTSDLSDEYTSLETELFGENVIIFADTDNREKINEVVQEIFKKQNDFANDAQFNSGHYAIYYKNGDYTDTECVPVGFYTHIGGLGKTPYDVKLNNIEVPAYLDENPQNTGEYWWDGGTWRNATCNFWRSAENLSVIDPETEEGATVAADLTKSQNWAPRNFNWSVAQAAPLRRVYSTRNVQYDWSYGWASGGYTADCYFERVTYTYPNPDPSKEDIVVNTGDAKTASGQQFFTRNSVVEGDATGTTLNNFNMGVISASLPNESNGGVPLVQGNGYSNWSVAGSEILDDWGNPTGTYGQQVVTNVTETPAVKEKPFLFMGDDGEYKIFVPSLRKNTSGISWSKDSMGEGTVMSLDDFYIAQEGDSAKTINEQLAAGKNIFFTPGVYYAEEVIKVDNPNTIVLGTGMATIVPTNAEAAMEVADVDGVTISGLIFDAGTYSKYLLKVGEDGSHTDHSSNPTLLQDLFFRVGGTTSELTKADDALIINSDDVISDHFWIWRADHGAGVAWDGNVSKHGLIVNGDDVTCYALFNEHFEEYDTLWNGENGATYFYQNEKCYDPISQEAWMSHEGTANGYAAYKVANKVNSHYAVGLGMYNVFIYTGPEYDASSVQIQLDNAIEVPNKPGVLVENACIQTFAKEEGVLQKFNHIINGVGDGVSSGTDAVTGETGEGWARKFLISYNDGTAVVGETTDRTDAQKGKFIGVETVTGVSQPMNEAGDVDLSKLKALYEQTAGCEEERYTAESWESFAMALEAARVQLEDKGEGWAVQSEVDAAYDALNDTFTKLENKKVDLSGLQSVVDANKDKEEADYKADSWKNFEEALNTAKEVLASPDPTQKQVDEAKKNLEEAADKLEKKPQENSGNQGGDNQGGDNNQGGNNQGGDNNQGGNNQGGNSNQGGNNNQGSNSSQGGSNNQGGNNNQGSNSNQGGNNNQGSNSNQSGNNQSGNNGNGSGNDKSVGKIAKTGDAMEGGIYFAGLCMIASAAVAVGTIRKRRNNGR